MAGGKGDLDFWLDFLVRAYWHELEETERIYTRFRYNFLFLVSVGAGSIYPAMHDELREFYCGQCFSAIIDNIYVVLIVVTSGLIATAAGRMTFAIWSRKYKILGDHKEWTRYWQEGNGEEIGKRKEQLCQHLSEAIEHNGQTNRRRREALLAATKALVVASWIVGFEWVITILVVISWS